MKTLIIAAVSVIGMLITSSDVIADNGKITVTQTTYSSNTNIAGFYEVELYYETGEMINGQYVVTRSELHNGPTSVEHSAPYYHHTRDHTDLVVGRTYTWKVWPTQVVNGVRVKDASNGTVSSGQTVAVAP